MLKSYIESEENFIFSLGRLRTTGRNESFHNVMCMYAPKSCRIGYTYPSLMKVAWLDANENSKREVVRRTKIERRQNKGKGRFKNEDVQLTGKTWNFIDDILRIAFPEFNSQK